MVAKKTTKGKKSTAKETKTKVKSTAKTTKRRCEAGKKSRATWSMTLNLGLRAICDRPT